MKRGQLKTVLTSLNSMGCGSSHLSQDNIRLSNSTQNLSTQGRATVKEPFHYKDVELDSGVTCLDNNSNTEIQRSSNKRIAIIHFNDVYNIESREQEPVGGAARFVTKVNEMLHENPLILFSGDCLNPSLSK